MSLIQEKKLLKDTKRVIHHHKELEKLKGETFNVFSILNMESKENATHSAFLGELLNPKGSHLKGNIFLQLFLKEIGVNPILIQTALVVLEKYIGKRDDKNKTGGRVDIYIYDASGNSICIENKIYAEDQNVQIERYTNHNKNKNSVYYLTLYGKEATKESRGNLKTDKDYYCISSPTYSNTLVGAMFKRISRRTNIKRNY